METTQNTFEGGLILDTNIATTPRNVLSNALNATITTFNGNELILLNDMGNVLIPYEEDGETKYACLKDGYIPLGVKVFGNIMYIFSGECVLKDNKKTIANCEIGSFPSPDYTKLTGLLIYKYQPLHVGYGNEEESLSLNTTFLNFDLHHPIEILAESSYDNSVNLIFTDNKNKPRLINTGFATREDGSYEIIRRIGKLLSHTNRYCIAGDDAQIKFDLETSLYRDSSNISRVQFNGLKNGGQLRVGTYAFYIIACDKDENESDFICESGIIPVFLGNDGDPFSVNGGIENLTSDKSISLTIKNIDSAYRYVKLYYTRAAAANNLNANTLAYKVQTLYPVTNNEAEILFTGYEDIVDISITDINLLYFNADQVKTQTLSSNILFLGNIVESNLDLLEYDLLKKASWFIFPEIDNSKSVNMNSSYAYEEDSLDSYYSSTFCYNSTGYHFGEIYRFGIVYIRSDNSLTSVFDVLGVNALLSYDENYSADTLNTRLNTIYSYLKSVSIDTDTNKYIGLNDGGAVKTFTSNEIKPDQFDKCFNFSGVSRICPSEDDTQLTVVGIKFNTEKLADILGDKINNYKGFFFVRLKRIPTLLALAYTTNVCEEAFIPSINIGESRYLYESFISKGFHTVDTTELEAYKNNFYPLVYGSGTIPSLFLSFQSRLFTLTDYTKFYRDKIIINPGAAYYRYAKDVSSTFNTNMFWNGFLVYIGDSLSGGTSYIMIAANNSRDASNLKLDKYWSYLMFGTQINESEIDKTKYHKDTYSSEYRTDEYLFKPGQCPPALHAKKHGLDENELSSKVIHFGLYDAVYTKKNEENRDYLYHSYVCYKNIWYKVDAEYWHCNRENASNAINALTDFYTDQCLAQLHNNDLSERKIYSNYKYIAKTDNSTKFVDPEYFSLTENNSSWDGKYQYPKEDDTYLYDGDDGTKEDINGSQKTKEVYAFKYYPMEYNAYAAFCPEYELYKGHYNNFFTGGNLVTLFVTELSYLEPSLNISSRLFLYNNSRFDTGNKDYIKTKVLGVDEGITLSSINLDSSWENIPRENAKIKHIIKRDNAVYFSSQCGSDQNFLFRFAGAKFLGYVFPNEKYAAWNSPVIPEKDRIFMLDALAPYNVLRGIYSPYLGCFPLKDNKLPVEDFANRIINIYISNYSLDLMVDYFKLRFDDKTLYQAISDRFTFDEYNNQTCYRGDCFIGWFTHRVNRNFNDSSAPYNDQILDSLCSLYIFNKEVFSVPYRRLQATSDSTGNSEVSGNATTKAADLVQNINVGDLNAVLMGSWVTFPIRASMNISIRSTDESWTDEKHRSGNSRSFYPLHSIDVSGSYKIPESENYNSAFTKSGNDKLYWNLNNTIFQKAYYKNRITYSNVMVNGAFENGNRTFLATHFRDYTDLYGAIVKILTIAGDLVVVCEHGILYLAVKERVYAGNGNNGLVFINAPNVLPETPVIISDTYGSTWPESIILTPYGIYGVDAVAKKIWYTNGTRQSFLLLSDFKVLSFLNKALPMWDKELEINKTNIKTHYNLFKNDIMFTAYDYENEDSVGIDNNKNVMWNLNFNINLAAAQTNGWSTFFSWIPSYSGNIGNNFITFDHVTDRHILDKHYSYLWKHGLSEFVPNISRIKPTFWYGELHPFEFEFVINANPIYHKIFNNLRIVANKAEPESFHYEVIGECYDFEHLRSLPGTFKELKDDRANMYYRQELTKAFYLICLGSDIRYNRDFTEIIPTLVYKSTMFPLYYSRKGSYNYIYDSYLALTNDGYEYLNLSGAEIIHDLLLDEFKICNHVLGVDITKNGRLRGNMHYKEDGWYVLIPSINYVLKNEYINSHLDENNPKLKVALGNNPVPEDVKSFPDSVDLSPLNERLGLNYTANDITFDKWDANRKEMRIKDKYLRIKVRYSGTDLAVISGILTLYTNSYS